MNRMPGWKETGFRDKVIKTEVGGRSSEVGGREGREGEKSRKAEGQPTTLTVDKKG